MEKTALIVSKGKVRSSNDVIQLMNLNRPKNARKVSGLESIGHSTTKLSREGLAALKS